MLVTKSKTRRVIFTLFLTLSLLLLLTPNHVHAQDSDSEDIGSNEDDTPMPNPSSSTNEVATSTTVATVGQQTFLPPGTPPSTPSGTPPTSGLPNPIFTSSDACIACQKEYPGIRNCTALLPPAGVNLTTIVQLLPFYGCFCGNDYHLIDSMQLCSTCFRSTGQSAHLHPQLYDVTNQGVKAFKKVCVETANGSKMPSSGANRILDIVLKSGSWMAILAILAITIPYSGL
ncbi:hypothetical protein BGZ76_010182 [Entomortierella beljakovae]|nr:hypothetical protein BGZ76_010182 [Entomortierella beljakovae]